MASSRIHLSLANLQGNEIKYIQQAISENWITSGGPNVALFEKNLETFYDNKVFVSALNSGTSAIHLALIMLGITFGDEVICQTMTFSASANPILYQGATPVFVDSEQKTWNICPELLEQAILEGIKRNKKPKAIIAVHIYGMPFQVDQILAISSKYDIPIIEDSAEAFGSTYKNQKCGTFGKFGIISFNGNKIITTSAGGILISNTHQEKTKAIFFATQSRDNAPHYEHSEIGYNYRMSNICASIGLGQLEVFENNLKNRQSNNVFYREIFEKIPGVIFQTEPNNNFVSNFWLTTILIDTKKEKKTAQELRLFLENLNIEARQLWKPLHLQNIFKKYSFYGTDIAEQLFLKGLCLPSSVPLNENEKIRLAQAINAFFSS
jgi:dTDP-4-amino-4,6-dideoxygalactose transaminase